MHDLVAKMIRSFARRARTTRDSNAMAAFRLAFTSELTADGVSWINDSHTAMSGDTVDNKETGVLTPDNLFTLNKKLMEQLAQDGVIDGHLAAVLVVPPALWKTAVEVTESTLEAQSAQNELNVYSAKFGLFLATSPYLGSAASGSETAYFLMSKNHSLNRWNRQAVQTDLIDWRQQRNNNYIYKGEYREVVGAFTYEGAVGSDGTV